MSNVFSLASFKAEQNSAFKFLSVDAHGGVFNLRSMSSSDMTAWIEEDNVDPLRKKSAMLRLVVRSLVDENKKPFDEAAREEWLAAILERDADENAKLIKGALEVNAMKRKSEAAPTKVEEAKND